MTNKKAKLSIVQRFRGTTLFYACFMRVLCVDKGQNLIWIFLAYIRKYQNKECV